MSHKRTVEKMNVDDSSASDGEAETIKGCDFNSESCDLFVQLEMMADKIVDIAEALKLCCDGCNEGDGDDSKNYFLFLDIFFINFTQNLKTDVG